MKKISYHLVLAFIIATQVGCSIRILTFDNGAVAKRDYDFTMLEVGSKDVDE